MFRTYTVETKKGKSFFYLILLEQEPLKSSNVTNDQTFQERACLKPLNPINK